MAKDSQLDPKEVRDAKSEGQTGFSSDETDSEGRNNKKQSAQRDDV